MTITINLWHVAGLIAGYVAVGFLLVPVLSTISCLRWRRQHQTPLIEALIGQARSEVLLFDGIDLALRVLFWPFAIRNFVRNRTMYFTGPTIRVVPLDDLDD